MNLKPKPDVTHKKEIENKLPILVVQIESNSLYETYSHREVFKLQLYNHNKNVKRQWSSVFFIEPEQSLWQRRLWSFEDIIYNGYTFYLIWNKIRKQYENPTDTKPLSSQSLTPPTFMLNQIHSMYKIRTASKAHKWMQRNIYLRELKKTLDVWLKEQQIMPKQETTTLN